MSAALQTDTVRLLGPLPQEAMEAIWPKAEHLLLPALEHEGWKMKPDQLHDAIASGSMGLYVAHDFATGEVLAALVAEAQEYPNAQVFSLAYCGGEQMERWAHLISALEQEAVRLGCHIVRIPGRKGWGHIFPDYREVMRVYEREIVQ